MQDSLFVQIQTKQLNSKYAPNERIEGIFCVRQEQATLILGCGMVTVRNSPPPGLQSEALIKSLLAKKGETEFQAKRILRPAPCLLSAAGHPQLIVVGANSVVTQEASFRQEWLVWPAGCSSSRSLSKY